MPNNKRGKSYTDKDLDKYNPKPDYTPAPPPKAPNYGGIGKKASGTTNRAKRPSKA